MFGKESTQTHSRAYNHLSEIFARMADVFLPAERLTVSQAATKYRYLNNPGSYVGPWLNEETPYMVEPMDVLTSRRYTGTVFCGPAQSAKTEALILNWIAYLATVEPADMLLFSPTMSMAKDFSMRRLGRMNRHSPEIGSRMLPEASADNLFEKKYQNGAVVSLSWPTVSQFAGRPVSRVALTDYDRMDDDIEKEGSPFDLGNKRTTTFGSFAMTLAESSPSRPISDGKWIRRSPHEAPPCGGILGLYNRGDRRRLYWRCPDCRTRFEGAFEQLQWDPDPNPTIASETVRLVCPHCATPIPFDARKAMLADARWLKDGQAFDRETIRGEPSRSPIASFWLNGTAARFTTWQRLVYVYLEAEADYERTQGEESLKKFYNTDLGVPYKPKKDLGERKPEDLKERAEPLTEHTVPEGVRFLVAAIDVQSNRFVVEVFGIIAGQPFDMVLIDRFPIIKSKRSDPELDRAWVKPGTYLEDWDIVTDEVLRKTYPLDDGSGRIMQIKQTVCDSGGREGVTTNAYNYVRRLRTDPATRHLASRFHLLKGDASPKVPRTRITYPDSSKKDKLSGARGDIPVLMLNSNMLKDALAARLECVEPGKGMLRFPNWLPDEFYVEMCAEYRDDKGQWLRAGKTHNEAWDLGYYAIGLCVSSLIGAERLPWDKPPGWADVWDRNDLVASVGKERFGATRDGGYDFGKLGQTLA